MYHKLFFYYFFVLCLIPRAEAKPATTDTSRLTPAQLIDSHKDPLGNDLLVGSQSKFNTPAGVQRAASYSCAGFLPIANVKINHPSGSALFPDDSALSGLLDNFLTNLGKEPRFASYFSKMHLFILNQIYAYLMQIYTNFTLTYYDSMTSYLQSGPQRGFIQKTTIINHLINIIEAQINEAVMARFPGMPQQVASFAGNLLLQQDQSTDLNLMLEQGEATYMLDPETQKALSTNLADRRSSYLQLLGQELNFFKNYTQGLEQPATINGLLGETKFSLHAQRIQQIIAQAGPKIDGSLSTKAQIETLRSANALNPPLFFYTKEGLRGVKLIPSLAATLSKGTQPNPWPTQIVADAVAGKRLHSKFNFPSAQPLAFFLDQEGNYTSYQNTAAALYVNIPTTQYMFAQQLLKEPSWLGTQQGVLAMTRACLGDFSKLLIAPLAAEKILDPALTCILSNAAQTVKLPVMTTYDSCALSSA